MPPDDSFCHNGNPSPVPSFFVVKKGVNTCATSLDEMPPPVSPIVMRTTSLLLSASVVTNSFLDKFTCELQESDSIAFSKRLMITCFIWAAVGVYNGWVRVFFQM